ncbi:two-component system response regulator QseB [Antricoccus suffuscus]|uniref:Two-component system response regulator QseB n=1 Tax=Antricoccus suffuscus TaxID=1629062 RepID=A0A2T0ZXH9_9ACTN|nr:response regulator transcription factor [Antricoccus suffuscus]PRZ41062.1 two-component system response regulator QseB [Antricoccus suffuscus]
MSNSTAAESNWTPSARLLLVEDDRELGPLLVEVLSETYQVEHARDGQAALHLALTRDFDVMIIDRGLPAIEGLELVARIRSKGLHTPILVLTARGTLEDKVDGLDAGAHDYMVKPFEIAELLARLRALNRRNHEYAADELRVGSRRFAVTERRVVTGDDDEVQLSGRESALLHALARHPGRVFTRTELIGLAFDQDDREGIVDTYVYYLRRKLGRGVIDTVHGLGYRLGDS